MRHDYHEKEKRDPTVRDGGRSTVFRPPRPPEVLQTG